MLGPTLKGSSVVCLLSGFGFVEWPLTDLDILCPGWNAYLLTYYLLTYYLLTYYLLTYYLLINYLLITYLLITYLLIPWSRVLLERQTGSQPIKKFPTFYGTRRFITTFTTAHHLSLS